MTICIAAAAGTPLAVVVDTLDTLVLSACRENIASGAVPFIYVWSTGLLVLFTAGEANIRAILQYSFAAAEEWIKTSSLPSSQTMACTYGAPVFLQEPEAVMRTASFIVVGSSAVVAVGV